MAGGEGRRSSTRRKNGKVGGTQRKDGRGVNKRMIKHIIIVTVVGGGVGRKEMIVRRDRPIITRIVGGRVTEADPGSALRNEKRANGVDTLRRVGLDPILSHPLELLTLPTSNHPCHHTAYYSTY